MRWILKRLFGEALWGLLTSEAVLQWVIAGIAGVLVGLSALITPVPWPYLLTAMFVTFSIVSGGLLWATKLREEYTIQHKVSFARPVVTIVKSGPSDDGIKQVQLGIEIKNLSKVPVELVFEGWDTQLDRRVPTNRAAPHNTTLAPNHTYQAQGAGIEFSGNLKENGSEAEVRVKLKYKASNRRRWFEIEKKFKFAMHIDGSGQFQAAFQDIHS